MQYVNRVLTFVVASVNTLVKRVFREMSVFFECEVVIVIFVSSVEFK